MSTRSSLWAGVRVHRPPSCMRSFCPGGASGSVTLVSITLGSITLGSITPGSVTLGSLAWLCRSRAPAPARSHLALPTHSTGWQLRRAEGSSPSGRSAAPVRGGSRALHEACTP
eukprot:280640-Chlamydomonas_euryale.AAC.1